jgi:hypothetical protein
VEQLIHCTPVVPGFSARWPAESREALTGVGPHKKRII